MISHSNRTNQTLRRHDLIFMSPLACRALLETRDDVVKEPLVIEWVDQGWPLITRRAIHGEADGLPLGLPLPPFAGKRRLAFLMQPDDIVATDAHWAGGRRHGPVPDRPPRSFTSCRSPRRLPRYPFCSPPSRRVSSASCSPKIIRCGLWKWAPW
jgi:hypothetical protein